MSELLKSLVIDSATSHLYIALYHGDDELEAYYEEGHNDHSVKLMSELEAMLKRQKMHVKDLHRIVIGIGPGSYTGLRVGVVIAKMFGWTLDIPVYQVSSLALLASSVDEGIVIPAVDARRGNAFLGLYEVKNGNLYQLKDEELTNLKAYEEAQTDGKTVLAGKPNLRLLHNSSLLVKVEDIHQLTPNYLRLTEAEKNAKSS
ncbi:MAG: tRNA (adenosine(37)-N6)-threonylcarbamoyltransferase complex dimerization subunit type 1 TsaB [Candidatus Izemoplasmataceae bacterium]